MLEHIQSNTGRALKALSFVPICPGCGDGKVIKTETEEWNATKLGLVNAVLDTLVPGMRLVFTQDAMDLLDAEVGFQYFPPEDREREIVQSLRDLAASIKSLS